MVSAIAKQSGAIGLTILRHPLPVCQPTHLELQRGADPKPTDASHFSSPSRIHRRPLTMKRFASMAALSTAFLWSETLAFSQDVKRQNYLTSLNASRRSFFSQAIVASGAFVAATTVFAPPSLAIPSVTVSEFEQIVRNSARSVQIVEFAGPKGDIVTVRLVDGTSFGLSDVIESATDPRSPLKLLATLRSYKIPTKFMTLENALSNTKTKRKNYSNERVQLAAEKEKEKAERLAQDAAEREAELYRMKEE